MNTGEAAIAAARRGWAVFPCRPDDKRPAVQDWENRACADPERVARYWPSPRHNVGIACGPSRLVVLDLDTHCELPAEWQAHDLHNGKDVFAQICEWAGMEWPDTYTVVTPSGGWHLYYQAPEDSQIRNSASLLGPQVDVRASGGYVVGVGSAVDDGEYEVFANGGRVPLPGWMARLLEPSANGFSKLAVAGQPSKRLDGLVHKVAAAEPGDRTGPLVWAAFRLAEMITAHEATADDGELLIQAAVTAGIKGGERYARQQVHSVLGKGTR